MHKSITITFGLLASSLVMLSAIPLLNNNNAAMAQGYNNMEIISYSQYPTEDKKYECRTGPFEGFFVSSVEFCKHVKFDDKKDHRDTKVGPPVHKVHQVLLEQQVQQVHQDIPGPQGPLRS